MSIRQDIQTRLTHLLRDEGGFWSIAVPTAISAGVSIWNAISGRRAAKKAADQQIAASNKAQGQLDTIYQDTKANMQPFLTTGQQANQTLASLMGLSNAPTGVPINQPTAPGSGQAMVQMRAPDGSVELVPQTMVSHYQQRGAQLVPQQPTGPRFNQGGGIPMQRAMQGVQ